MKTNYKLLVLAILISFGFTDAYKISGDSPGYCDNSKRYPNEESKGGGKEVPVQWAEEKVKRYREAHAEDPSQYKTTGFLISKKVFEKIFDKGELNTMTIDLVVDDDGKLGIVVKGITTEKTGIETPVNSGIFISQSLCPVDCAQY